MLCFFALLWGAEPRNPGSERGVRSRGTWDPGNFRAAASGAVMRSGRYYAEFTLVHRGSGNHFGVIQADWDVEDGSSPHNVAGHCFDATDDGKRSEPVDIRWILWVPSFGTS